MLDIRLSDGTSFDLLSQVKPSSAVIFTTAYDEYAIRAFSVNSIDYILKPVDEARLAEALEKFEVQHRSRMPRPEDYIDTLLDALQRREKRYRTRFLIAGTERYRPLQVKDIAYFYSENKVTTAVTFAAWPECRVSHWKRVARPVPLIWRRWYMTAGNVRATD